MPEENPFDASKKSPMQSIIEKAASYSDLDALAQEIKRESEEPMFRQLLEVAFEHPQALAIELERLEKIVAAQDVQGTKEDAKKIREEIKELQQSFAAGNISKEKLDEGLREKGKRLNPLENIESYALWKKVKEYKERIDRASEGNRKIIKTLLERY